MKQKTIGEIKAELKAAEESMLPVFIENYKEDTRSGVQAAVAQAKKRIEKLEAERVRIEVLKKYEYEYAEYTYICGIDEAGRGPLAGPVAAGAVILPKDCDILYIKSCLPQNVRHSMMRSWKKQWQSVSVWSDHSGSMRSIFYRRPMKPCGRL